jgi:hypothetical protein
MKKIYSILFLIFTLVPLYGQTDSTDLNMTTLDQSSKIGAVIGVIMIIFVVVLLYLLRLEMKLNSIKKKQL